METNSPINYGEYPNIFFGKNKKFVPVIIAVVGLLLSGITFYGFGVFDKKEEKEAAKTPILNVEKSKQKELEGKKIDFSQHGKIQLKSESSTENYKAIAGEEPKDKLNSNENLSINDYEEVRKADWNGKGVSRKAKVNRRAQAQIEVANRQNKRLMQDDTYMYRQTKAEEEEARREHADRLANERQQNLILDQLEKANANSTINPIIQKANNENEPISKYKRNNKVKGDLAPPLVAGGAVITPVVSTNTTAQFWSKQTGFYNLNSKVSKQSYSENRGILAVVHGDAEGISVTNGQELKIRLLEPLRILEQGENIILPIGTLIPTIAKIGSDRLFLTIEGIFLGK